jgi:hypothetical protein
MWVALVRNESTPSPLRKLSLKAIDWLRESQGEALDDLGLSALPFAPSRYGPNGVVLLARAREATPYYLRGLEFLDVVVRVEFIEVVGDRREVVVRTPTTPTELADALRSLRESRRNGSWTGGVMVIRKGQKVRIGAGRL